MSKTFTHSELFRRKHFIVIFSLIFSNATLSWAQIQSSPGYIVTNSLDTLKGFIENRSKGSDFAKCYFRKTIREKSTVYTPADIVGFALNNLKYYKTITVKDEQGKDKLVFATILLPGRASLFRYQKDIYLRHDSLGTYSLHFNTIRDLTGMNKIRGKLNFIFADCKRGKRVAWDSIILTDEKIIELVKKYNACKNSNVKLDPKNKIPGIKGNFGILAGVDIMNLQFASFATVSLNTLEGTKFENSSSPLAGLTYSLTFPSFTNNFSVLAELGYFKSKISGHASGTESSGPFTEDVSFSANYIKTALGVRILIPTRTVTPFLKCGISLYSATDFMGVRTRTDYINNAAIVQVTNPWTSGNQNGIWIGGGVMRRISNKLALSVETRFDRTHGYNGPYPAYPLNGTHLTFLFGISF